LTLFCYLLTPWSRVLEKLTGSAASQEIPHIFGTRSSSPYSQVPAACCVVPPLETLSPPPGDPSRGVVYLRIVLSPEEASRHVSITKHLFSWGGVVSTSPNPQAGGPPLVGCPRLLIQFIRSYPPYQRPFFHPQPEDAPCCGDRDPLITWDTVLWCTKKPVPNS